MGQDHSEPVAEASPEQRSQELAQIFSLQCYTPLEIHCFKQVFKRFSEAESGLSHWSETTLCGFLEIPDVLEAGPVLHQMATFLASYPYWELCPCILTASNLLKVITLLTGRYKQIIQASDVDVHRILYASMAVVDRRASEVLGPGAFVPEKTDEEALEETLQGVSGFSMNHKSAKEKPKANEEDDDSMSNAAFMLLKTTSGSMLSLSERPEVRRSIIPSDNFLKLVELLLFITPLRPQTNLSEHSAQLSQKYLRALREAANAIVASFAVEESPGITYNAFRTVIPNSLPYIFSGLNPLFEHFLFDSSFDLSKRHESDLSLTESSNGEPAKEVSAPIDSPLRNPGEILDLTTLTQLSFFIPSNVMFYRLHFLFSGNEHGFSLGSFEKQVFNWRAPTLLLVRGTLLPDTPSNSRERSFADSLPSKRFPNSQSLSNISKATEKESSRTVTYGAYIPTAWKHAHKSHFGNASTILFQLSPIHDVFRASAVSKDYASYNTPSNSMSHGGINFGSPLPSSAGSKVVGHSSHGADSSQVALGPVSLYLDDSLEFGVFTHTAAGGGSFHPSTSPARTHLPSQTRSPSQTFDWSSTVTSTAARRGSRGGSITSPISPTLPIGQHKRTNSFGASGSNTTVQGDWQDRFEIEALEVWGCGGDEEMEKQRKRIENEERDARLRKEGIIGRTGDVDVDREILMMAGLIGQNQYGGSIQ